jgi:hypothetical protein
MIAPSAPVCSWRFWGGGCVPVVLAIWLVIRVAGGSIALRSLESWTTRNGLWGASWGPDAPMGPQKGRAFTEPRMRKADYAKDLGGRVAHSQAIPNQPRRRLDQLPPVPPVTTAPLDRVRKELAGAHRCWKPLRHGVPPPLGPVAAEPALQPNFRGCTPSPISSKSMTSPLRIAAGRNLPATIDVPAHTSAWRWKSGGDPRAARPQKHA